MNDADEQGHQNVTDLPVRTQDYLKTIFDICERTARPASLGEIATSMGQKSSTASEAVKKLGLHGYLHREPYQGITLSEKGRELAIAMVRRHRLVESFLMDTLNYGWDEVHEEAEMLEHAISDKLLARIDAYLGFPRRDPHGDPIPTADGVIDALGAHTLQSVPEHATVTVERIHDHDPEILRYLHNNGVTPGVSITVGTPPFGGMTAVHVHSEDGQVCEDAVLLNSEAVRCIDVSSPTMNG